MLLGAGLGGAAFRFRLQPCEVLTLRNFGLTLGALQFDLPLMLAITVLAYAVCVTGNRVVRGEGLLMLLIFVSYVGWLTATTTGMSIIAQPIALTGLTLTALLVGFQVYGLKLQRWSPVPET